VLPLLGILDETTLDTGSTVPRFRRTGIRQPDFVRYNFTS
jgi:hypothetical protein